ncbi:urease accessory protein UreD [Antrihabitans cavernicola]|uniref:Urease accessory protein UreD n=2 Tax=Antrihabitans cavernicola TaxID=2495913 RepID=A0A5A7S5M4_9NOCA|nr:urease accessory protein UreD [Spelaeibacter cavernicola]
MLGVGAPGKVGLLELGFERVTERTELVRRYQKSPLQIMRPLYIDPLRPDLAVVFLMSTGGGIVQADRLRMDIDCGADTSVHLTTQAATRVHRMDRDYATQVTHLDVGPRSYVEYLPESVIPYGGARYYQQTVVTADPTATILIGEGVHTGRHAHGEHHHYDVFASDLEIRRPDGDLVAVDAVRLDPGTAPVAGPGVLGNHTLMSTFYAVSPLRPAADIATAIHTALQGAPVSFGTSVLPQDSGAWVRVLGNDSPAMVAAMRSVWNAVRQSLIDVPAPALRKT